MKPAKTTYNLPTALKADSDTTRDACIEALSACDSAVQKSITAGQRLNEFKLKLPGQFMEWRRAFLPEISDDTCERWQRAALNVAKQLPLPDSIDVETLSISTILTTPDSKLTKAAAAWKQQWFDFTADKTIKDCLVGVIVNGDAGHRVDRAVNGRTKGGYSGEDRKDFPLFIAVKQRDTNSHLSHWKKMTELQRTEIKEVFTAAILGDETTLRGRKNTSPFRFDTWPEELCMVVRDVVAKRLKGARS